MTALTVRLPNSVNQFIAAAVSEKMALVMTLDYLKQEAAKGSRNDFDRFMSLVPDAPVAERSELPLSGASQNFMDPYKNPLHMRFQKISYEHSTLHRRAGTMACYRSQAMKI
jgi:hypothetical protein